MNNQQFRSLLASESQSDQTTKSSSTRAVLGGRRHGHATSQAPSDKSFAQSVRERSSFLKPKKQFKSSDPRGSKVASGYIDRAKARTQENNNEADVISERIESLKEQLKHGTISRSTFETERNAITGGDISSTHLVRGLDRRLLERVRQGEDVMGANIPQTAEDDEVDDELDKIEVSNTERLQREAVAKKGHLAESLAAGRKRTRDEIMADLKARRKGTGAIEATSKLDDRWTKVSAKQKSRVEVDRKGREILLILDEDGKVIKKLRKPASAQNEPKQIIGRDLPGEVLGADIKLPTEPDKQTPDEKQDDDDDDDDDIFEGVGADYDPFGGDEDDDDSEADADDTDKSHSTHINKSDHDDGEDSRTAEATSIAPAVSQPARNYFNSTNDEAERSTTDHFKGVEAMIAKAARLATEQKHIPAGTDEDKAAAARQARHAAMLNTRDRDMDDLDLGFGESRFEDGDEEDTGKHIKLSQWSDLKSEDSGRRRKDRKRQ